ncbi:MAG TPA: acyltransferase [Anaerolineae bacterium]|nr:acyltransferase [Anaerolineae bacterium]
MQFAGYGAGGRLAMRLAAWFAPPHKDQVQLAHLNNNGFIASSAAIYHAQFRPGKNVYIGDRVIIYQARAGGPVMMGDRVTLLRDSIIETGSGGSVNIGDDVYIHPRCQMNAYLTSITIGRGVMVAANCVFYPHNHGIAAGSPIREQPLETKGPIVIGEDAWLGTGVVVLGGVTIGAGAVVGAGSVVMGDIPVNGIAVGSPAKVVKMRDV